MNVRKRVIGEIKYREPHDRDKKITALCVLKYKRAEWFAGNYVGITSDKELVIFNKPGNPKCQEADDLVAVNDRLIVFKSEQIDVFDSQWKLTERHYYCVDLDSVEEVGSIFGTIYLVCNGKLEFLNGIWQNHMPKETQLKWEFREAKDKCYIDLTYRVVPEENKPSTLIFNKTIIIDDKERVLPVVPDISKIEGFNIEVLNYCTGAYYYILRLKFKNRDYTVITRAIKTMEVFGETCLVIDGLEGKDFDRKAVWFFSPGSHGSHVVALMDTNLLDCRGILGELLVVRDKEGTDLIDRDGWMVCGFGAVRWEEESSTYGRCTLKEEEANNEVFVNLYIGDIAVARIVKNSRINEVDDSMINIIEYNHVTVQVLPENPFKDMKQRTKFMEFVYLQTKLDLQRKEKLGLVE